MSKTYGWEITYLTHNYYHCYYHHYHSIYITWCKVELKREKRERGRGEKQRRDARAWIKNNGFNVIATVALCTVIYIYTMIYGNCYYPSCIYILYTRIYRYLNIRTTTNYIEFTSIGALVALHLNPFHSPLFTMKQVRTFRIYSFFALFVLQNKWLL